MNHISKLSKCRICGNNDFQDIIDLGEQCIANAFHPKDDSPTLKAPIKLVRCNNCELVQLAHSIDCDLMYRNYWYKSSINKTMRDHLENLIDTVTSIKRVESGDTVIDIGANDGFTLGCYKQTINRIGVDPSNIKPANCNKFINDYFTAKALEGIPKAKVITSIAMFYDLNDPKQFVRDIEQCLATDGIWVLEMAYLGDIFFSTCYDTCCHEHVCYYCLKTFELCLEGTDLEVFRVELNDINGGSFKLYVAHKGAYEIENEVIDMRKWERNICDKYQEFVERVAKSKEQLMTFLNEQKSLGKCVYGYGASTKGQVVMQYCGITPDLIKAIAERNPDKHELYTPGTNVRICSEEEMRANKPDYLIIFPWHFLSEFKEREKELMCSGTKLVVALPKFEVI